MASRYATDGRHESKKTEPEHAALMRPHFTVDKVAQGWGGRWVRAVRSAARPWPRLRQVEGER